MSRWIALIAVGCGHAAPPAPQPHRALADAGIAIDAPLALDDDLPRLVARSVAMYVDIARVFDDSDCTGAAAKLQAITASDAEVIAANQRMLSSAPAKLAALHAALRLHGAELDTAAATILHSACANDDGVARALARLGGGS